MPTEEPPVASILDALSNNTIQIRAEGSQQPESTPAPETPETPTPETATTSEPPKQPETPPEPQKPAEIPPELKGKARENFARLEQAKREAEEKAKKIEEEWKTKYEESQSKIKEYESKISQAVNPEEFQRQIEERDRKLQELQNEYRLVALERDPDFIATYDRPRQLIQDGLKDMALQASVSEQDFQRAIRLGDQSRLEEIRDSLPAHLQRKWDASLNQIEQINIQREIALKDKEQTYQQLSQQRQEQFKQQHAARLNENLSLADKIAEEPFEKIESLRENTELKARIKATLQGIAGGKGAENWTAEKIMRQVAAAETLQHFMGVQNQVIEGQKGEMETLKKSLEESQSKIKELETFITQRHGALPNNEVPAGGAQSPTKTDKPIWEEIVIQAR